jgi:hypothetical protein
MRAQLVLPLALICWAATIGAAQPNNAELQRLFDEDQASRTGVSDHADVARRRQVFVILAQHPQLTPPDQFNAAMVLLHTDLQFAHGRLASVSPENYLLAHELAKQAFVTGENAAGVLVAQTLDRYLTFTEGRQRYGTNRLIDRDTEVEFVVELDNKADDAERARLGLPPLKDLIGERPIRRHLLPE